ncbi:MAG: hypothetical protein V4532_06140 [Pseudomonadota bacterium]
MNPYVLGVGTALIALSSFTVGWKVNGWRQDAQQLIIEQAAQKAADKATDAAVTAIQGIRIQNRTIRQELEREIVMQPAVGVECNISDGVFTSLNKSLAPRGDNPAVVPGPVAAP